MTVIFYIHGSYGYISGTVAGKYDDRYSMLESNLETVPKKLENMG
jgi:hypothetical protein